MFKKLKQLFCQHDWTETKCINFSGYRIKLSVCEKCGKTAFKAIKV